MFCFILLKIRLLPLPSPNQDSWQVMVIELRVDKVSSNILGHYLLDII